MTLPTSNRGHSPLHLWDDEWLALRNEDVIEPGLPIVDAHHHLWQRKQPYFAKEMLADIRSGHMIRGTVFTECTAMYSADGDPRFAGLGEVEYANGIGAEFASGFHGDERLCAGIVGRVDLTMGPLAGDVLAAYVSRAPDRFRGIRHMAGWDADPVVNSLKVPPARYLMLDPRFREGLGTLGPLGLSFDAHCYHPQLSELTDLVDAFPNIPFVVNHMGGLVLHGIYAKDKPAALENWRRDLKRLAERPNTFIKIGGLSMRSFGFDFIDRDLPPTSEELSEAWKPLVETCIEAFGPHRAMLEANFPVDKVGVSYRVVWNTFKRITAGYSATERSDMFAGTAVRVYRLPAKLKVPPPSVGKSSPADT